MNSCRLFRVMGNKASMTKGTRKAMVFTDKHFILGKPIREVPSGYETAVFATGCFWGAEKGFWRMPGVHSTAAGYVGGQTQHPTYEETCTGRTGHTEAVRVVFDPSKIAYSDLLRQFWECHDPTQVNGQGGDRGTQYRSGVYTTTPVQKTLAASSKAAYETALGRQIATEIGSADSWFYAEDYHQQYLAKPGSRQYCSAEPTGVALPPFSSWAPKELEGHKPILPEPYWAQHGPKPGCVLRQPHTPIQWSNS